MRPLRHRLLALPVAILCSSPAFAADEPEAPGAPSLTAQLEEIDRSLERLVG